MKAQITEKGLITILTLACCTTLLLCGKDTAVGYTLLAVVVGYFGIEVFPVPQIRQRKGGRDG